MTECRWCGETHLKGICPKVKVIEFAEDGETVRRVEFMTTRDCMPANGWPIQSYGPAIGVRPYLPPIATTMGFTLQSCDPNDFSHALHN